MFIWVVQWYYNGSTTVYMNYGAGVQLNLIVIHLDSESIQSVNK